MDLALTLLDRYRLGDSDVQGIISHFVAMTPRAAIAAEQVAAAQDGQLPLYAVSEDEDDDDDDDDEEGFVESVEAGGSADPVAAGELWTAAQQQHDQRQQQAAQERYPDDTVEGGYYDYANDGGGGGGGGGRDTHYGDSTATGAAMEAAGGVDSDWAEMYDETYDCPYYYNHRTQQYQ